MEYQINPSAWGPIFTMPTSVVDEHIKMVGRDQLKILLWLYRHASDEKDLDAMCADTGIDREDAIDAMQYWIGCGLVKKGGGGYDSPCASSRHGNIRVGEKNGA